MAFAHHGVAGFHFVLGGMDISAKFQLGNLFHLEDRENGNDELEVTVKVIPSALDFPPNKSVTAWQPITQMFKEIYTAQGAKVRWDIKQVLVRFRLRANVKVDSTSSPNLLLEALVLPTGTWEAGVPEPKKKLLSSNHSSAIRLWSQDCAWYSPLPHLKLPTAPGISRIALDVPLPSEIKYRWAVQVALRRSDHGKSVVSREEFETYLAAPYPTNIGSSTPFWLPYPFGYMPDDSDKVNSDQNAGLPSSLDKTQFQDNIQAIHESNNSMKHPAQKINQDNIQDNQFPHNVPDNTRLTAQPSLPAAMQYSHLAMQGAMPTPVTSQAIQPLPQSLIPFAGEYSITQHQNSDQEVTQRCPLADCSFSSYITNDRSLLETCFKQLTLHLLVAHGVSETSSGDAVNTVARGDKASREYQAATKPRTVKKVIDDATFNLSEARFFPFPLDLKTLGMNMPMAISPVNTVVDLSHLGVDVTNPELLRKLHNRANTVFRLREFSDTNLRNYHAAGDELVAVQATKDQLHLSKPKKQLDDPQECVRAFYNYCALSRNFHVLDWSPMCLMKLVLEKYFFGPPTVEQFTRLFEKFIHENAGRAQRRAVPLTYPEVVQIWNIYITPSPLNTSSIETVVDNRLNKLQLLNKREEVSNREGPPRGRGAPGMGGYGQSPVKKQRFSRDDYCQSFNTTQIPPYCTNTVSQGGCIAADGRFLKHACNKKVAGKFCNSDKHNYFSH